MIPEIVDHIVYAVPDLDWGIEEIHEKLGIKPVLGGSHKGFGTRNALLSLGRFAYLEILAPDPEQESLPEGRWMGVSSDIKPKLITWASRSDNLNQTYELARKAAVQLGDHIKMNRVTPAGDQLKWEMTSPNLQFGEGLIPFYVNWINTPHPSQTLPFGGELVRLSAEHPDPQRINAQLSQLNINLPIQQSASTSLSAYIQTSRGLFHLT